MKFQRLAVLFGALFFYSFSPAVAAGQPQVILDQLLTGDAPALNANDLNIPKDLTPGFHELTVEIYDEKGVISTKSALFCKDTKGELHFDNICPDLLIKKNAEKKRFNPLANPDETINFMVLAFALSSVLIGQGNKTDDAGSLDNVDSRELATRRKKFGWGDNRKYIDLKFLNFLDDAPASLARQIEKVSTLFARIVLDARYLRVIFANLAWLTMPAAMAVSYLGVRQIHNQAVPMTTGFTLALALIGLFDPLAGAIGAYVYLDFVFANGHLNSKNSWLFALGYAVIFFAPALIASKFRPLHRTIGLEHDWWTRLTDYVLGAILTGVATTSLIKALNGLSGYELSIAKSADRIGIYIALALLVRMLFEEFAWYLYPNRTRELHYDLTPDGFVKKCKSIAVKIVILWLFTYPIIGWNKYLAIGSAILFGPQLFNYFSAKLPKTRRLVFINPRGALRMVLVAMGGIVISYLLTNKKYSDKEIILNSFIFMPIPGAILSLLDQFTYVYKIKFEKNKFRKYFYRYSYRLISILVLIALCILLSGHNPVSEIQKFWAQPTETIHSLTYKWWPEVKANYQSIAHWIAVKRGVA